MILGLRDSILDAFYKLHLRACRKPSELARDAVAILDHLDLWMDIYSNVPISTNSDFGRGRF